MPFCSVTRALVLGATLAAPLALSAPQDWPGEKLPLPLEVRTPEDLAFKQVAERQYLLFNLLASGKRAWDAGDARTAAERWEALLAVPGLPAEMEAVVRPFAERARQRAGGVASAAPATPAPAVPDVRPANGSAVRQATRVVLATVEGVVRGGGAHGPGGAVVWLKRADGKTPPVGPGPRRTIVQRDKKFFPHVLAVPQGTTVDFLNEDLIHHNVFSLSDKNDFDLGMTPQGARAERTFKEPGPVSLLCNVHSSMAAYVYVVDSPWYAQADRSGRFTLRNVPPGEYVLEAWHESARGPTRQPLLVRAEGTRTAVQVAGDRPAPAFVPDKAGRPRQPQLGY